MPRRRVYNVAAMASVTDIKDLWIDRPMTRHSGGPLGTKPRAIELFAGVGGFRVGLKDSFDVVWSNQWEPSTKRQDASDIYVSHFNDGEHICQDIDDVLTQMDSEEMSIPPHDLLVGGFPCQDYSVARVLNQAAGLAGKKGVLWWSIYEILKRYKPRFILLENVDRLLKSPATQRGRDFAIMLRSLSLLGYRAEWRVVNAAHYGFPQRRRRVFIVGQLTRERLDDPRGYLLNDGILARALPVEMLDIARSGRSSMEDFSLDKGLDEISETFGVGHKRSMFCNAGVMDGTDVHTADVTPISGEPEKYLRDILLPHDQVDDSFFIPESQMAAWERLKGAKKETRIHRGSGTEYTYAEGAIAFPDPLDGPSRTILTGEGGTSPSRFKHVVEAPDGRLRRLTPIEMERLNGFPDDWTKGVSDGRRAFLMGNALVVGVVDKIGVVLKEECAYSYDSTPRRLS